MNNVINVIFIAFFLVISVLSFIEIYKDLKEDFLKEIHEETEKCIEKIKGVNKNE